jgi:hypothetical protein
MTLSTQLASSPNSPARRRLAIFAWDPGGRKPRTESTEFTEAEKGFEPSINRLNPVLNSDFLLPGKQCNAPRKNPVACLFLSPFLRPTAPIHQPVTRTRRIDRLEEASESSGLARTSKWRDRSDVDAQICRSAERSI